MQTRRSRSGRSLYAPAIACMVAAACVAGSLHAQSPKPTEYDVEAAYLLNFGKFIRHSSTQPPRSSFDICILGPDPMGRPIDDLARNETIDNLPVHIQRLPDVSAAKPCAIVFISANEGDRLREDLAILAGSDVLTVSDASDFLARGGIIQFVIVANHVRFRINLDAANRSHIVLSSELLRVASSVTGKPPTGEQP